MGYKQQYEAVVAAKSGKSLSAVFVEWKTKGQQIVGRLMAKNSVIGQMSTVAYNQYLFETDEGFAKCALGSATDNEAGKLMVVGGVYAITFQGQEVLKNKRHINRFDIIELQPAEDSQVGGESDVPI